GLEIQVLQADVERVHTDRIRRAVDQWLASECVVRMFRATKRAVLVAVRHDSDLLLPQVRDRVHRLETCRERRATRTALCARVANVLARVGDDGPVALDADLA